MAAKLPVIEVGPGNFGVYAEEMERRMGAPIVTLATHNTYLRVLAENGLTGAAALVGVVALTIAAAARRGTDRHARWWLFASLIALLVNGLFIDTLHFRHLWLVWAFLLDLQGPLRPDPHG